MVKKSAAAKTGRSSAGKRCLAAAEPQRGANVICVLAAVDLFQCKIDKSEKKKALICLPFFVFVFF